MAERLNAAALKAVFGVFLGRGFESLPLRFRARDELRPVVIGGRSMLRPDDAT